MFLLLKLYISQAGAEELGFFGEQKRLVSSYVKVIAVFRSHLMQIRDDRCVANNNLPLNYE